MNCQTLQRRLLGAEAPELSLEELALPRGAGHDHAVDAGLREPRDLVGGERPATDLDERLRASARGVAEPLGLAAAEDDRLHDLDRLEDGERRRAADALVCEPGGAYGLRV